MNIKSLAAKNACRTAEIMGDRDFRTYYGRLNGLADDDLEREVIDYDTEQSGGVTLLRILVHGDSPRADFSRGKRGNCTGGKKKIFVVHRDKKRGTV